MTYLNGSSGWEIIFKMNEVVLPVRTYNNKKAPNNRSSTPRSPLGPVFLNESNVRLEQQL